MRWLSKVRFRFVREQKGIGLLEVIVAAAIMGLIGVGFLAALNTNSKASGALDERVTAANLSIIDGGAGAIFTSWQVH